MVTEDYVSFEVAKLLKEKGFREDCIATYSLSSKQFNIEEVYQDWTSLWSSVISAPTLQMACKWLREVHNIYIDISSRFSRNADTDVCFTFSCKKLIETYKSFYEVSDGEWLNYEEVVEVALKYTLENLI